MSIRWLRSRFVLASLGMALLAGAQPVFADTELGHKGTVGVHSLTDNASSPGATCKYKYLSANDRIYGVGGDLKRILLQPPNIRAVTGMSAQKVGWKITVQRRIVGIEYDSGWVNRYTSPEMTAVTDDAHDATFSTASVRVITPFPPGAQDAGASYRVIVTMIWHRPDDSVRGTARHRVSFYRYVINTGAYSLHQYPCGAAWDPSF